MFLVLLKVFINKEASGGVHERSLNVVHTLIPARRERGCSCGHLRKQKILLTELALCFDLTAFFSNFFFKNRLK